MKKSRRAVKNAASLAEGYGLLFERNPQPMFILDRGTLAFIDANQACLKFYGYDRAELLAMKLPDLWPERDRPVFLEMMPGQPESELYEVGIRRHVKKDGTVATVSITRHGIDYKGRPAIIASVRDISEVHSVREALREKEDLFRLLVEGVKDYGIVMLDSGGRVLTWNEGAERNTGYDADEVVGRHWSCFHTPEDVKQGKPDAVLIIAESKGQCREDGWRMRKDGSRFYADCVLSALRDSEGRLQGFACIMRDVTEKKNLERKILEAAEREQKRIGQDLHDSLGQRLTGIGFLAKALEQKLAAGASAHAKDIVLIREKIVEAGEETRRLARGLYSAELEANRLVPALRQLLEDARLTSQVEGELICPEEFPVPERAAASQLYYIAQEAIHNAIRHGKAAKVWLKIEATPAALILSVRDNGIGIPDNLPQDRGLGLRIMNYRAELIGGHISVTPHPNGGTLVTCRLSVEKNATINRDAKEKR